MAWKIRSKSAFIYEHGHHRYIIPKFKTPQWDTMNEIPYIIAKTDQYSQVRVIHNYRNISRAAKQFLLGDPIAEQLMLIVLRSEFLIPVKAIQSPIANYTPIVGNLFLLFLAKNAWRPY